MSERAFLEQVVKNKPLEERKKAVGALKEPKSSRCSAALSCLPPGSSVPPLPLLPTRLFPAGVLLHGRCLQACVCLQKTRSNASDGEALKVTPGLCCSALLATVIYGYARAEGPTPCQFLNVHLQTVLSVLARPKAMLLSPPALSHHSFGSEQASLTASTHQGPLHPSGASCHVCAQGRRGAKCPWCFVQALDARWGGSLLVGELCCSTAPSDHVRCLASSRASSDG